MAHEQKMMKRLGGVILGLLVASVPLACGGMTAADPSGDDGAGGAVSGDGVAGGGTGGGTAAGGGSGGGVPASGGTPAAGGQSATGGQAATGGGGSTACNEHSECVVVSAGCCGACEPVAAADLRAVNWEWYQEEPACDVVCGACEEVGEVERTADYFIARCAAASCQLVDVRDDYAECSSQDDCLLRDGNGCCEDCDGEGFIAVSSLDFVSETACPEIICPGCISPVPEGLSAECNVATGRCEKVQD